MSYFRFGQGGEISWPSTTAFGPRIRAALPAQICALCSRVRQPGEGEAVVGPCAHTNRTHCWGWYSMDQARSNRGEDVAPPLTSAKSPCWPLS